MPLFEHTNHRRCTVAATALLCMSALITTPAGAQETCPGYTPGNKSVFWGDLHVHSGYSLDAWGFGTANTPKDAYAFARGESITLPGGQKVALDRPLDFMAVTDHAEWFNLMYACSDPMWSNQPYCNTLTEKNAPATGSEVFREYVVPTITRAQPEQTELCTDDPEMCAAAQQGQWHRIQVQANQANDPCAFTSFVAFEWSATPDFSHNHRNVIFADENAVDDAIDYLRFPTPEALWRELDRQCKAEDGCDVIAIPHNTNMGDGKSFDVETENPEQLALRARYERLVEIHQEKGNSECLPAFGATDEDCNFEIILTRSSQPTLAEQYSEAEWERMRGSYVRRLLLRGLYAYDASGKERLNPLQLGIIGSTDTHAGTGGFVEEDAWPGSVFGGGSFERTMARRNWNPGGLVAVWAEQNTRSSIFAALKRREVYATSGPRMRVRIAADEKPLSCDADIPERATPMGGTLHGRAAGAHLLVQAQFDRNPLQRIEIIKGEYRDGELHETVTNIWQSTDGALDICATWQDEDFDRNTPAFWYARVLEAPSRRWSAHHCQREDRCDEYPDANVSIRERAWTSPIWHLPGHRN